MKMRFNQAAAALWDDPSTAGSLTPKLSLFSLPAGAKKSLLRQPPPSTPPLNSFDVSIPFNWEELPGKPRPRRQLLVDCDCELIQDSAAAAATSPSPTTATIARGLKLPPRLVSSSSSRRVSNMPSPEEAETKLGGEYRPAAKRCASFSNGSGGRVGFGSGRWGNLVMMKLGRRRESDYDYSVESSYFVDEQIQSNNGGAKIIRIRRRRSLFNLSAQSRLASIYRSVKQVVIPSRRRE
ncbi:hypothetical protein LINPERHAP2_LOCUS29109 [Linum perenne]